MFDDTGLLHRRYAERRSPRDLEVLVGRYRGLATALARRYVRPGVPAEDLEQVACVGLVKALQRFDPGRGCAFSTFAVPTILGELRQFCRQVLWPVHVPRLVQERVAAVRRVTNQTLATCGRPPTVAELARRLACEEEDVVDALHAGRCFVIRSLDGAPGGDAEDGSDAAERWLAVEDGAFEDVERRSFLETALERLTDVERDLVRWRFVDERSHREIATRIGMSASHVSRLLDAAIERLADDEPGRRSPSALRRRGRPPAGTRPVAA